MEILWLIAEYLAIILGTFILALVPIAALGGLVALVAFIKEGWENS